MLADSIQVDWILEMCVHLPPKFRIVFKKIFRILWGYYIDLEIIRNLSSDRFLKNN